LRLFSHGPPPSGFVHQISLALSIIHTLRVYVNTGVVKIA
jgi:hypothetical protein